MRLRDAALACALGEAARGVRESGGANRGPDVTAYLKNAGINVPAAWCAAYVQAMSDRGAKLLGVPNPLDDVQREALVADYVDLARQRRWIVGPDAVRRGDLAAFRFGTPIGAWNHIAFVMDPPVLVGGSWSRFWTCEGNTNAGGSREGDGVYVKGPGDTGRLYHSDRVCFIAWDGGLNPNPAAA
ncbi:MAG: hypothetical protein AB7G12_17495 [Thermoanaerobaculia bacterium]